MRARRPERSKRSLRCFFMSDILFSKVNLNGSDCRLHNGHRHWPNRLSRRALGSLETPMSATDTAPIKNVSIPYIKNSEYGREVIKSQPRQVSDRSRPAERGAFYDDTRSLRFADLSRRKSRLVRISDRLQLIHQAVFTGSYSIYFLENTSQM
jgi:hypothetical protein